MKGLIYLLLQARLSSSTPQAHTRTPPSGFAAASSPLTRVLILQMLTNTTGYRQRGHLVAGRSRRVFYPRYPFPAQRYLRVHNSYYQPSLTFRRAVSHVTALGCFGVCGHCAYAAAAKLLLCSQQLGHLSTESRIVVDTTGSECNADRPDKPVSIGQQYADGDTSVICEPDGRRRMRGDGDWPGWRCD